MTLDLNALVNRDYLPHVAKAMGWQVGVEIGTYRGEFAAHILTHWEGLLHTVDPWTNQPESDYLDGCNRERMDDVMRSALQRLAFWTFHKRCNVLRTDSVGASRMFADESVDFVFIDGNHARGAVDADLQAWWPKVRSGGLLGLHDTYERDDAYQRCGVWPAVWDFAHAIGQRPRLTPCTSSWFVKP